MDVSIGLGIVLGEATALLFGSIGIIAFLFTICHVIIAYFSYEHRQHVLNNWRDFAVLSVFSLLAMVPLGIMMMK